MLSNYVFQVSIKLTSVYFSCYICFQTLFFFMLKGLVEMLGALHIIRLNPTPAPLPFPKVVVCPQATSSNIRCRVVVAAAVESTAAHLLHGRPHAEVL